MQRRLKNAGTGTEAQPGSLNINYTFSSPTLGAFSSPASLLEAAVRESITRTDDWLPPRMLLKPEMLPVPGGLGATNFPNGVLFEGTAPGVTRVEWKTLVRPR